MQLPGFVDRIALRIRTRTGIGGPLSRTRLVLAFKAALAAVIAWYVVAVAIDDATYPYYAPLGATLAMGFSVAASVRESLHSIAAIGLGVAIALACDYTLGTSVLGVALVIGVGVLIAGWHRLGTQGTWVPTSALFVLILAGDSNVVEYVSSYGGLTLAGMLVGIAVNAVFPAHPLARFDAFANRLRHRLADQLDGLADGLGEAAESLSAEEWAERREDMLPMIAEVRAITHETAESSKGNLRARRYKSSADIQYTHAQLLERITFQTEALTQLISEGERSENRTLALGSDLQGPTATALRSLASLVRLFENSSGRDARKTVAEAHRDLRLLEGTIQRIAYEQNVSLFYAVGIANDIRTTLHAGATLVCQQ